MSPCSFPTTITITPRAPPKKQSDGEAPVMLELWEMWTTPALQSLPGPLWPRLVASNRVLSKSQIELFDIQTVYFDICIE